jgi:hypothetical protein
MSQHDSEHVFGALESLQGGTEKRVPGVIDTDAPDKLRDRSQNILSIPSAVADSGHLCHNIIVGSTQAISGHG